MPAAIAIPAIAAVVGAGVSAYGQHKAGKQQQKAGNQAIDYAREQEVQRRKEFDIQQQYQKHADETAMAQWKYQTETALQQWKADEAKAKFMWDEQQRQLAPYRAARGAVLGKYGIAAAPAPREMPAGFNGIGPMPDFGPMPSFGAAGPASAGQSMPPQMEAPGGNGFAGAFAQGLGAAAPAIAGYFQNKRDMPPAPGGVGYAPMSPFPVGTPGGPQGPPAFAPVFENLSAYQQYGVPGQDYQGE